MLARAGVSRIDEWAQGKKGSDVVRAVRDSGEGRWMGWAWSEIYRTVNGAGRQPCNLATRAGSRLKEWTGWIWRED